MAWFKKKDGTSGGSDLPWEPEALERLNKTPAFMRENVRAKVEQVVRYNGGDKVTLADYHAFEGSSQAEEGDES